MDYIPQVVQAVAGDGQTVYAYLNDGTVRLVDVAPLIIRGGIFSRIADEEVFRGTLTVMNGTVAWDISGVRDTFSCIDLDPITIYESGAIVRDPFFESVA